MKRLLSFTFLFLLVSTAWSQPVSSKIAASAGIAFLQQKSSLQQSFVIADTIVFQKNNLRIFYLFPLQQKGFVIVAANKALEPILGYSLDAPINSADLPDNFSWWLDQQSQGGYERIMSLTISPQSISLWDLETFSTSKNLTKSVLPLCSTKWDQGCYYNAACPSDTLGQCGHSAVGCVATAMAQVMKYWNYPSHGKDTHTLVTYFYGSLFANFANASYNWASMNDSLSGPNPAVAQLMSHCGIAADMEYGSTSSSSWIRPAPLTKYFKYSLNAQLIYAANFDSVGWINRLHQEIDAGRPMLFAGMPQPPIPVGHAWVCDGYDAMGYMHFNWGWSGSGNGYFQTNGYSFPLQNSAVVNLMPVQSCDVLIKSLVAPVHQTFYAPANITVRVANYDTLPHVNIPIYYSIDNGPAVRDTITDTIHAYGETSFTFSQAFDFSALGGHDYQIRVYTDFPCDSYRDNDSMQFSVRNVLCADPPYTMGFETSDEFLGWWVVDANTDGHSWNTGNIGGHSNPGLAFTVNCPTQSNDWLISKCISLDTAQLYKLSFWYKSGGMYWPEDFKVYMGNSNAVSSLTHLLAGDSAVVSATFHQSEAWFTVPNPGSYYFGWHCYSDSNTLGLSIDDVEISKTESPDIGVIAALSPVSACDMQTESITVTVKNYCSVSLSNIPISYVINGNAAINDIIPGPIPVGGSTNFTFAVPTNCSIAGLYTFKIYTSLSNDTLNENDTLIHTVINQHSAVLPYSMGFEASEDYSEWTIENTNEDSYTWSVIPSEGHAAPSCARYPYSAWVAADDWLITKCLHLIAGKTYRLRFQYKVEDPNWAENMAVYVGPAAVSTSLNTLIINMPGLTNASWTLAQPLFSVPSSGFYYIGWKCYSPALMFNLYLDDIYLEETTLDIISEDSQASFNIFPNPGKGLFTLTDNSNSINEKTIEITDIMGTLILSAKSSQEKTIIDLTSYSAGIYLVHIITNGEFSTLRLIKE